MRGKTRLTVVALFLVLVFLFFLASPFGSHAGKESRRLISQVVEKVQKGEIGPLRVGSPSESPEELAMREWEYRRAVQYEGTGARIHHFLDKARSGRPFTVSVIGGSVSKGRGLIASDGEERQPPSTTREGLAQTSNTPHTNRQVNPLDDEDPDDDDERPHTDDQVSHDPEAHLGASTLYSPENVHVLIFDWLNATFPHAENKLVNGAQGGVGAGYFSWCFKEHIAEDSDLVLVELGINDLVEIETLGSYEHLIRGVLELPNSPAVINIETFTTLLTTLVSSSALHLDVAAFYDIPSLSIRDILLPRIREDPDSQLPRWFRTGPSVVVGDGKVREWGGVPVDLMHISALGHALAAGLVIRYLSEQIDRSRPAGTFAALGRLAPGTNKASPLRILDLPKAALTMPFDPDTGLIRHDPTCRSMNSPLFHPVGGSNTTFRGIAPGEDSQGWTTWAWKEKMYLIATEPKSRLTIPFTVEEPQPIPTLADLHPDWADLSDDDIAWMSNRLGFEPLPIATRPEGTSDTHSVELNVENEERRRSRTRAANHSKRHLRRAKEVVRREYPAEEVPDGSRVLVGYLRSATIGLGSVFCWVDDDQRGGSQLDGWWNIEERNMGMVEEVASGIQPGEHVLNCELLQATRDPNGSTEFRIFAIMHD